jgi:hypothetical protein
VGLADCAEDGNKPSGSAEVGGMSQLVKGIFNFLVWTLFDGGGRLVNNTGQQNLTFFLSHEEKYLLLIELLTLNSNM